MYAQADRDGRPVRVGKATHGLETRYRGGTAWALDAAMHESDNQVFVAPVDAEDVDLVEDQLIWDHRENLSYTTASESTTTSNRRRFCTSRSDASFRVLNDLVLTRASVSRMPCRVIHRRGRFR